MAITSAVCDQYKQSVMKGIHRSGDAYKIALFTSAATLDQTTTAYSATNEASGTGYSAGGTALSGFTVGLSTHTATLDFADASWPTATITARGALIYNTSSGTNGGAANEAVAVVSFGASDIVSTGGTFLVTIANAITLT
jgi:hypothetical protein